MYGDMFSLKSGEYRQFLQVAYGGGETAVSTTTTVKVGQPIATFIATGATARFKQP